MQLKTPWFTLVSDMGFAYPCGLAWLKFFNYWAPGLLLRVGVYMGNENHPGRYFMYIESPVEVFTSIVVNLAAPVPTLQFNKPSNETISDHIKANKILKSSGYGFIGGFVFEHDMVSLIDFQNELRRGLFGEPTFGSKALPVEVF